MSNTYSLDDIRNAAEAKYGSTDIDGVRLLNPLRLPKTKRDQLRELQDVMSAETPEGEEPADQAEYMRDMLRLVAENPLAVERLIEAIGDDLAVLATVLETYTKGTQAGEA